MNYTSVITGEEPISVEEVAAFLRVDYVVDDPLLDSFRIAAREIAENFCNRSFIEKTITLSLTDFEDPFILPFCNHKELVSVNVDGLSAEYTKTGISRYTLTIETAGTEAIIIYKTEGDTSERVKNVLKQLCKELYDNRGEVKISENAYVYMLPLKVY